MIYFVQQGDSGPVKIGYSATVRSAYGRLAALQTAHAEALVMRAVVPGDREEEAYLHEFFAATRLRGEWFRPSTTLWVVAFDDGVRVSVFDEVFSRQRWQRLGYLSSDQVLTDRGFAYLNALEFCLATNSPSDLPE